MATALQMEKKKKKNKGNLNNVHIGILVNQEKIYLTQFSPHFGEKTFWWVQGENTWTPSFILFPLYPTKYAPKKFSFLFFLQSFSSTMLHLQTNTS